MNERYIGKTGKAGSGPALIIIAGMHGNEPAGIHACKFVFDYIARNNIPVSGQIIALKGNLQAIKKGVRFIDKDLNRLWTDKYLSPANFNSEISELKELQSLNNDIKQYCDRVKAKCVLLDLHTFSAETGVFTIPSEQNRAKELAGDIGVTFIDKLTHMLPGTIGSYYAAKGISTLAFEGGNHLANESLSNMVAAIFIILAKTRCITPGHIPELVEFKSRLKNAANGLPHHMKLVYRHQLEDYKVFKMNSGYTNFQKIRKGEVLATENSKDVCAPMNGYILMPLYQEIGSDGFFIVREN